MGILPDLAWGLMGSGFVFLGMLAFAWKVHYTMLRKQKLTGVFWLNLLWEPWGVVLCFRAC